MNILLVIKTAVFLVFLLIIISHIIAHIKTRSRQNIKVFTGKAASFALFMKKRSVNRICNQMRLMLVRRGSEFYYYSYRGVESIVHPALVDFIIHNGYKSGNTVIKIDEDSKMILEKNGIKIKAPNLSLQLSGCFNCISGFHSIKKISLFNVVSIVKKGWSFNLHDNNGSKEQLHPLFADFVSNNLADTSLVYDDSDKSFYLMDNRERTIMDSDLSRQLNSFYLYQGIENDFNI